MTNVATAELEPISVDLSTVKFTAEQFDRVCEANPNRSFELTAQGVLVIMPPVGVERGNIAALRGNRTNTRSRSVPTAIESKILIMISNPLS
jgi:Uma2 family endonuclease